MFSDIISVIALLISILAMFFQTFPNRKKLICNTAYLWKMNDGYGLAIILENYSRLPISIISLKMIINEKEYLSYNQKIFLHGGSIEVLGEDVKEMVFTDKFPINLDYLSSNTFRTMFLTEDIIDSSTISLVLKTTRGLIEINNIKIINEEY